MPSDHFSDQSSDYLKFRPNYPQSWLREISQLPRDRQCAWDCATGNGQAAVGLSQFFQHTVATDVSLAQLSRAQGAPRLDYLRASAEHSGLAAASVDLVVVAQALHWFGHGRFWQEVRRVVKPGGLVVAWVCQLPRISAAVDLEVSHFFSRGVGDYWPPERRHVEQGYSEIDFPFARVVVPELNVRKTLDLGGLAGYISSWSAVNRYRKATGTDPMPDLLKRLSPLWGDPLQARSAHWPTVVLAGRV